MQALRTKLSEGYDRFWDGLLGIDSAGADCRPTAYRVLRRVFAALPLAAHDHFVDIGCGRGRVLCLAALQPVARAVGVEINAVHAALARQNLAGLRGRRTGTWGVTTGSAAEFDLSGGTVFYMFNPFGGALFSEVATHIGRAIAKGGKPARVVYVNPVCRDVLDGADWLAEPEVMYRDRDGKAAALLYRSR